MSNSISFIVTCQEQQPQLMRLLPQLLSMRLEGQHEVIVVDKEHDKDMQEWLEEMEVHYPTLSHTFCPASSRGIDIQRLALTLGAKASTCEWLVILQASAELPGEGWLQKLMAGLGNGSDLVVGLTDSKRKWNRFRLYLFRRRFSLFRPASHIILCRRRSLLENKAFKLSKQQVIKLFKQQQ